MAQMGPEFMSVDELKLHESKSLIRMLHTLNQTREDGLVLEVLVYKVVSMTRQFEM